MILTKLIHTLINTWKMQPGKVAFSFFYTLTFLFSISAFSQSIKLTGKVTDFDTKEDIPFCNIYFTNKSSGTVSDIDGNYTITKKTGSDTLIFQALGYLTDTVLTGNNATTINIALRPDNQALQEVVVTAGENPAYRIIRNSISNKSDNTPHSENYYTFSTYSKLKFGLKNINPKLKNRKLLKPFSFFFENTDSSEQQINLPVFLSETVSEVVHFPDEKVEKEIIKGSKVSGVKNESISAVFTDLSFRNNFHSNHIHLFNKNFISPIADNAFRHYEFELNDSSYVDGYWCYKIKYWPKHKQELAFTGIIWITDTTFAVKEIEAYADQEVNINLITDIRIKHTYAKAQNNWVLEKEQLVTAGQTFVPHAVKSQEFFAKKLIVYKNFDFTPDSNVSAKGPALALSDDAQNKDEHYWEQQRGDTLSKNEKQVYILVDSLRNMPLFKNYLSVFTAYKNFKYFELGPYYTVYNYNPVEGNRIKIGLRTTPSLSKNILITGHIAYGFKDQKLKYGAGVQYFLKHNPRVVLGFNYKYDVEQLGYTHSVFRKSENFLSTVFRIYPQNRLTFVTEYRTFIEKEWFKGLSNRVQLKFDDMKPLGKLEFTEKSGEEKSFIRTSEIILFTHFGYKEKFLKGDYNQISLGSIYPIIDLAFVAGIKGLFGSEYEYQKLIITSRQRHKVGGIGEIRYRLEAGKIWGKIPYPLLELHPGNQTIFLDENIFNAMSFFEFVSDQYASINLSHHFEGYFFNKIPGIRKLKLREVLSARTVAGSLKSGNTKTLLLPEGMYTLNGGPYAEVGLGIENILRFLRIDLVRRVTYLNHSHANKYVIKGTVHLDF